MLLGESAYGAEDQLARRYMSKTVVIGASSGLGRCIGVGLAQRGEQVAMLARRRERIEAAAKEAGPGAVAVECDVTDEASFGRPSAPPPMRSAASTTWSTRRRIGPLARMVETDAETWRRVFDTNVTGPRCRRRRRFRT